MREEIAENFLNGHQAESRPESDDLFRILFEYAPDAYYLTDLKGTFLGGNRAAETLAGYRREELIGKNLLKLEMLPRGQIPKTLRLLALNAMRQPTGPDEFKMRRKDGSLVFVEISTYPVMIKGKTVVLGIARDITERKKAAEELRESEEKFKGICASAQDAILMVGPFGRISYWNRAAEEIFGYSAHEAHGRDIHSWLAPESLREVSFEHLERFRPSTRGSAIGRILELEAIRKDGVRIPIELSLSAVKLHGEWHAVGVARDISERRRAKEKLEESLEKLRKSMEGTIRALTLTVDLRSPSQSGHQRRVADLALAIATEVNLPRDKIDTLLIASLIHDLGKISVPGEILNKPGRLDEAELQLIREHPKTGYDILKKIDLPGPVAEIVYQHHERMNGSGYPRGLAGQEILLEARILGVAEAVEAMVSHRPYRAAMSIEKTLEEISRNKGVLYDRDVVEACLRVFVKNKFEFR